MLHFPFALVSPNYIFFIKLCEKLFFVWNWVKWNLCACMCLHVRWVRFLFEHAWQKLNCILFLNEIWIFNIFDKVFGFWGHGGHVFCFKIYLIDTFVFHELSSKTVSSIVSFRLPSSSYNTVRWLEIDQNLWL